MNGLIGSVLILIGGMVSGLAHADGVIYETPVDQVWQNDQATCADQGTCDLKKLFLRTQGWIADFTGRYGAGAYSYGDTATFGFETTDIDALDKYGAVQMLRGCVFDSQLVNGKVVKSLGYVLPHLGPLTTWKFPNWVIDSDDSDPLYNSPHPEDYPSMKHKSRLGIWRWNVAANSFDQESEAFFGFDFPPKFSQLYVQDRPGTAFYNTKKGAKNLSIQFRVCFYKLSEIPLKVTTDDISQLPANPIACKEWSSSHVYNWESGKFESPGAIDPFCK